MSGRRNTEESFWSRVEIGPENECWPWLGYVERGGYGLLGFRSICLDRPLRAHQVSWSLMKGGGSLPAEGMVIHHLCGNRFCVNPAHLEVMPRGEHTLIHNPGKVACQEHGLVRDKWGHCWECKRAYKRQWTIRRREAKAAA